MSSMTPEGKVKEKIKKILKDFDVYYFMPRGTVYGRSGIPDFVCCYRGKYIAIEAKSRGRQLTALQLKEYEDVKSHGGRAIVIDEHSLAQLETLLMDLKS